MSEFTEDKYCTLPGAPAVRLDSTDGHVMIVGEEPRPILKQFVSQAKGAGLMTEQEMDFLRTRLAGNAPPSPVVPPGTNATLQAPAPDATRLEQIKTAMIEMINTGTDLTGGGVPQIDALRVRVGLDDVTTQERDYIFKQIKG